MCILYVSVRSLKESSQKPSSLSLIKGEIQDAAGSRKLCMEAVVHSIRKFFEKDMMEAILLVYASYAFIV